MKYIRTKDDIYEKHNNLQIIDNSLCIMQNKRVWWILGEVLKQADTIEELIDCYVILYKDGTKGILFTPTEINIELAKTESVYGSIFTDKGIIHKAKMNDKGKLELI